MKKLALVTIIALLGSIQVFAVGDSQTIISLQIGGTYNISSTLAGTSTLPPGTTAQDITVGAVTITGNTSGNFVLLVQSLNTSTAKGKLVGANTGALFPYTISMGSLVGVALTSDQTGTIAKTANINSV